MLTCRFLCFLISIQQRNLTSVCFLDFLNMRKGTVDWSWHVSWHVSRHHTQTHRHTHALRNRCLISVESTLSPHTLMLFLLPLNCPLYCTHPSARTGDACTQALTALHVNKPAPRCLTDTFEMTSSMWPVFALLLLVMVVVLTLWRRVWVQHRRVFSWFKLYKQIKITCHVISILKEYAQ